MTGPMLDSALSYAARGWPVFPCHPGSKEPATAHGFKDATTNPAQIQAWWTSRPDCNIGIATGAPGPDVIDIDVKPDGNGYDALAAITQAGLTEGQGAMVRTRSGGLHIYFTGSDQGNGAIRNRHVDFRGRGGYVIAPPSWVNADDKGPAGYYELLADQPATAPVDWQAARTLVDPPPDPVPFTQPSRDRGQDTGGQRPGDAWAAVTPWAGILRPHGWRLTRDLGNGRAMWRRPGKTDGSSATTREDGGLYVFSTSTEFEVEVPYSKFGALAVLDHGGDHAAAARALREAGYGDPMPAPAPAFTQPAPAATEPASQPAADPQPAPGVLADFDLGQLAADGIPEPERVADGMLYRAGVHVLAGVPGGGKTTLMAWWMLQHIRAGGSVMLLDEESGPDLAAEKFLDLGATPDELRPPNFTYLPFPSRAWRPGDVAQLHALLDDRRPGIVGWDSVAAFLAIAGADENSAGDVTAFWQKILIPVARHYRAAVIAIDHLPKNGDGAGYSRGSGAKKAASDVQYMVETVKAFNRQQDGILRLTTSPGKDRRGYLATAYQVTVKTGDSVSLEITEASAQVQSGSVAMKPGKAKLWEALNAIATEEKPASSGQLVDWIARTHGHGLKRQTVSTYLNELAADSLAESVALKPGTPKFWYPANPNLSPDASDLTRQVVSAPPIGADNPADTLTPPADDALAFQQPRPSLCTGCGERHRGDCYTKAAAP